MRTVSESDRAVAAPVATVACIGAARRWTAVSVVAFAGLFAACSTPVPDRFYRLTSDPVAAPATVSGNGRPVVAVGSVDVPEIVDRAAIVTQGPGHQVFLNEQHRWAEPLKTAIGRLVAERLSAMLGGALVSAYPATSGADVGYRVSVSVQRFDSVLGVAAETAVLWSVRRVADNAQVSGRSALRTVPADAGIDAIVAAHAKALQATADEIAAAVASLAKSPTRIAGGPVP